MTGTLIERLWESDEASRLTNEAARSLEAAEKKIAVLEKALEDIRELNLENEDENGHRWANSELIEQTIVLALSTT